MRLKKLLAAVVSGALAVMSLASLPVSAANYIDLTTGSIGSSTLAEDQWNAGQIAKPSLTLDNKWGNAASLAPYSAVEVEYTCGAPDAIANLYLVAQANSDIANTVGWLNQVASPAASGTITLDLSSVSDKNYEAIVFLVEPASTYGVGDTFDPQITITAARFVSADTTEYTETVIATGNTEGKDHAILENGVDFDFSRLSDKAKLKVYFSIGAGSETDYGNSATSGWGIGQVCYGTDSTWWDGSHKIGDLSSSGPNTTGTAEFKFSDIKSTISEGDNLYVQVHEGTSSLTKISILEDASFTPPTPSGITLNKTTATVKVGETVTLTATPAEGVTWSSSDTAVATVANGVVTGVAAGTATITATDGTNSATCTVTVTAATTEPGGDTPASINRTLWEGTQDMGTGWDGDAVVKIDAAKFADITAGETIKINFTKGNADYFQLKISNNIEGWPVLDSPEGKDPTYGTVVAAESPFTFVISAADLAAVQANGMVVSGYGVTVTKVYTGEDTGSSTEPADTLTISQESASLTTGGTVTLTTTPAEGVAWTTSNADVATVSGGVVTAVGAGTATITATLGDLSVTCEVTVTAPAPVIPSRPSNVPSAPVTPTVTVPEEPQLTGSVGKGWNAIEEKIAETADGGKVAVDMNGVTKLPKEVLDNISGEDVDLVLNMKGGVTWTINGTDVDKASDIDMKVTVGTRAIPEEAIEAVEGGKSVKQISLAHNGTFGFTATMTISLGKLNDGQYANLFYYNPKSKSLEFVDASIISGGKANLIFNHASDYAIIMSDAPLGEYEDVSAAAGVISSESADTTVFFACGAVVLAVAAAYAIYRKRSRG